MVTSMLTVVIACQDRQEHISYCVHSILSSDLGPKVIVVDFGSQIPLTSFLPSYSNLRIIRVQRDTNLFHKARALNIGMRVVDTPFTCISDADQIFAPDFFATVLDMLNYQKKIFVRSKTYFLQSDSPSSDPSVGISIVPQLQAADATYFNIRSKYPYLLTQAKQQKVKPRGYGCCHGVATDWLLRVRGYDEAYLGWGAEDRDLEVRAGYDGFKIVWASDRTTMVHLPHTKNGTYYNKELIDKNMKRYERLIGLVTKEKKIDSIIANKSGTWGEM
jgi:hypothetical protein